MTPNQAVLVTAARLRLWVNVKEYGLGGGPRRRALGSLLEKARRETFATGINSGRDCAPGELLMTTARQTSGKVFYGWWVVLAAGVGLALHAGPLIVPTFGVFLKPLSQEFGWSRTQISLAFSLFTLGVTQQSPLFPL